MASGIEFVPLNGKDADSSLLADTTTLKKMDMPSMSKPLLSRPGGAPLEQSTWRARNYQPWKRHEPTSVWEWQDKNAFWGTLGQAGSDARASRGAGRRFRDAARTQFKMMGAVMRKFPSVVLVPLLVCGLIIGLGIYGVRTAANNSETSAKADAEAAALKVASSLALSLDHAILPVLTLGVFIRNEPGMAQLEPKFSGIAEELLAQASTSAALQLKLVPFGIVRTISPQRVDLETLGVNLFTDPTRRDEALQTVQLQSVCLAGPLVVSPTNHRVLIARNPVFISGVAPNETWGNGDDGNTNCSACYNATTRTKFWGFAAVYIDFDMLTSGPDSPLLLLLRSRSYLFSLVKPASEGSQAVLLAASSPPPSSGVNVEVEAPNDNWQLQVYPTDGFRPKWEGPLMALVVVVAVALSSLLFVALVNHRRLLVLLRARLPVKALEALRVGRPFSDYLPACTVLDCDVVRYTNQEAGLDPLEVVKLLNDVYAILDDIVEKHGLHKVETFGDSYLCVGGCPDADSQDAITWAAHAAHCAREMVVAAAKYRSSYGQRIQIQIGVHSGPLVAAVIDGGKRLPRYCLFGDTVSLASEMTATSQPMAIHVSRATAELLAESGDPMVMLVPRGITNVRGRSAMFTSWLQVDLMAGAYGGAYGGRQSSVDLLARHRDDDEVSLDGFNMVRKALPGRDSDDGEDGERGGVHPLFGSFSRRLDSGSWAVVCDMMGISRQQQQEEEGGGGGGGGAAATVAPGVAAPALMSWPVEEPELQPHHQARAQGGSSRVSTDELVGRAVPAPPPPRLPPPPPPPPPPTRSPPTITTPPPAHGFADPLAS